MVPSRQPLRSLGLGALLLLAGPLSALAHAQASAGGAGGLGAEDPRYDPFRHDLRLSLYPVHIMGARTQSHVGSSMRVESDLMPRLALAAWGRVGWQTIDGVSGVRPYGAGVGLRYFFIDGVVRKMASGTVYPADTPIPANADGLGTAIGNDRDVPVNQKLGGPRMGPPEVDEDAIVPLRSVHALRLGYDLVVGPQVGSDDTSPGLHPEFNNRLHMLHAGWGWGDHWNLPASATGQRELGFRRLYLDLLVALPGVSTATDLGTAPDFEDIGDTPATSSDYDASFMPLGVRLGIGGAVDAFFDGWEGFGLSYLVEAGALPGYSGLEGYLFVAVGIELDAALFSDAAGS